MNDIIDFDYAKLKNFLGTGSRAGMQFSRRLLLKTSLVGTAASVLVTQARSQWKTTPQQQAAPLHHIHTRSKRSLDGDWRYIVDPFDAAKRGNNTRRTFWKNTRSFETGPLVEYDWEKSPLIDLPRDWNSHSADLAWYNGPVYFRRTFDAVAVSGERRFLCFEAVNYHATVWLNSEKIGEHEGGFTPFAFDITDRLKNGENAVVVCADGRHHAEAVPTEYTDWQNYGGITRSVWIASVPDTRIDDVFVRLENNLIIADIALVGPDAAGQTVTIKLGKLKLGGTTDAQGKLQVTAIRPRYLGLWTPEHPTLHTLSVTYANSRFEDRIGLRTISTRGRELIFNGKPIYLRGISMHEEPIGPVGTRRMTEADARQLLLEAKSLGCNFIRLAHYPHSEITLRIADELGLIVWAEIPVYWEQMRYDSPHTLALARSTQRDMIMRDRNRCSIGLWSVANETPPEEARTTFLRALIEDARALDPTRLITAALNKNVDVGGAKEGQSNFSVTDDLAKYLDVLAINQYEAWYSKRTPAQLSEVSFSTPFDKPIMFSEFGADALAGHRGPKQNLWTEDYQAWLYEETLKVVDRTPGCVGLSPWILKDFRSPRRWHPQYQQYWNRKGLISETGVRKAAFEVLRKFYLSKAKV